MNGFEQQNRKGKRVEKIVQEHFLSRGHQIIDVSDKKNFQIRDTDIILRNKDGINYTTVEIKRDDNIHRSSCFFFELESENENGYEGKGWVDYSVADYICFYDTIAEKGYVIAWTAVKPLLSSLGWEDYYYDKLDSKIRFYRLVPIGTLRNRNLIVYEWGGNKDGKEN